MPKIQNPLRIFSRKPKQVTQESVPQLTLYDRRALEYPGAFGSLPVAAYDEMETDSMIQTAMTIKKQAVLAASFKIIPSDDSALARQKAEFVSETFNQMEGSARSILLGAMDAFVKGWSVQEMVFETHGEGIHLKAVRQKDPSNFGLKMDAFGQVEALTVHVPGEEQSEVPREKFVIYINRGRYGKPKGVSDLDAAWKHYLAKKALQNAWRAHLERFASPTILGRYERGLPPEEQSGILGALRDLHQHTAIVFPKEIEISTLHGSAADNESFLRAIEFHNREIARSILGQTLTTDEGRRVGSLALGKVHLQILMLQIDAIRRELADSVMTEQVIRTIVEMQFGPGPIPRFEFDSEPNEMFSHGRL
jgi:phage gp29-like protein